MQKNPTSKQQLQMKIDEKVAEGIYVNVSNIMSSESEFIMDFGRIMPAKQVVTIHSRIISSPQHAKSFLLTLQKNIAEHEEKHGEIKLGSAAKPQLGFQGGADEDGQGNS